MRGSTRPRIDGGCGTSTCSLSRGGTHMLSSSSSFELGYEFDLVESPWVKADDANHRPMYGQVFLVRPDAEDVARVDVHFGTYSIGYAGYLRTSLRDLSTTMRLACGDVGVLRPEGCIVLAQAHALSDGYVSVKDVNDFVAIASSGEEVDWERAGEDLRAHTNSDPRRASWQGIASGSRRRCRCGRCQCPAVGYARRQTNDLARAHDRSWRPAEP